MNFFRILICGLLASAGISHAQNMSSQVLVEYPFLCPSCDEARMISVRYAADGTSVLETHARADTPQVAPDNDDSEFLPGEWIAGPMTDFKPGRIQHWEDEVGTNFIEVQDRPLLQDGVRYVDRRLNRAADSPGQESWSIDEVTVSVSDGSDDREIEGLPAEHLVVELTYRRTEYGSSGAESSSSMTGHTYDLWMSDALPFSPLPFNYEPFVGNRVPPYNGGPVGDRLMAELVPRLEEYGGLLRAEITAEGDTSVLEVRNLYETSEPPMEKFGALPVVASDQVSRFAGPLFIASLLRGDMLGDASTARFTLDGRESGAVSEWKTNSAGDLVIVISATGENTSLFLSRPVNGLPEIGTHDTTAKPSFSHLREMDEDEIEEHTGKFQLNGVVTNTRLPTVLTGFEGGTVTISAVEGDTISGSVSGTVSALPTDTISQPRTIPVEVSFTAAQGLEEFQFRSEESRVVD